MSCAPLRSGLVQITLRDYHQVQMRGVVRARLPEGFYFFVAVACLLSALAIYYFFVASGSWRLLQGNRPRVLERAQLNVKVWADKQTGLYYCAGSHLYGHTQSGQY